MNAVLRVIKGLTIRQLLRLFGIIAAKIFWHLPAVILIRLPVKFLQFIVNPKNKMKAFILTIMIALAVITRYLITKAVERRERL